MLFIYFFTDYAKKILEKYQLKYSKMSSRQKIYFIYPAFIYFHITACTQI